MAKEGNIIDYDIKHGVDVNQENAILSGAQADPSGLAAMSIMNSRYEREQQSYQVTEGVLKDLEKNLGVTTTGDFKNTVSLAAQGKFEEAGLEWRTGQDMGGSAALRLFVMPALKPLLEKVGAAAVVPFLFGSDKLPDEVAQDLIKKMEAAKNAAKPYDGNVWATSNDKSSFGKKVDAYTDGGDTGTPDPDDEDDFDKNDKGKENEKNSSINQMNKNIQKGNAPDSVKRVDKGLSKGEQNHVHFNDNSALNRDGTWKHGNRELTNIERKWLKRNNWILPGK